MKPKSNHFLKFKLCEKYGSLQVAALELGISNTRLSRILHGWVEMSEKEKRKMKSKLGEGAVKAQ